MSGVVWCWLLLDELYVFTVYGGSLCDVLLVYLLRSLSHVDECPAGVSNNVVEEVQLLRPSIRVTRTVHRLIGPRISSRIHSGGIRRIVGRGCDLLSGRARNVDTGGSGMVAIEGILLLLRMSGAGRRLTLLWGSVRDALTVAPDVFLT